MTLHNNTFGHVKPTPDQQEQMGKLRVAYTEFAKQLEQLLPDGPDKTYVLRQIRDCAMWSNQCLLRNPDGSPRDWGERT